MPPPITFDSSEKVRVLLRYALCWGLHIDHPDFAKKLAEHGIKTARKTGGMRTYVAHGTIRSALIWYLGKDCTKLLPAYTIGKGESTLFEVRMRVLKHDGRELEAAVMNMNISNLAQSDVSEPDSCLNMPSVYPLEDVLIEDDLMVLMNGTLEQNRQDREREQARQGESEQEKAEIKPGQDYPQKQQKTKTGSQKAWSKQTMSSNGNWVHIAPQPTSSSEQRWNLTTPKASPLRIKCEPRESDMEKQYHTRESVTAREQSLKNFSLYKNASLGDRLPTITEASSEMIGKLLPQPLCIPSRGLRRTILLGEKLPMNLSSDWLGNTRFHYNASQKRFIERLENLRHKNPKKEYQESPKLNDANQSWLFTMVPKHLNYSTFKLRQLIDTCGSGTPWYFHGKLEACSSCVSLDCARNAPPHTLQDCHGQTWLHQYLYHNKWTPERLNDMTETGERRAVELLTLCKHYRMDPGVKDNMGRTILDFLIAYTQSDKSEDLV